MTFPTVADIKNLKQTFETSSHPLIFAEISEIVQTITSTTFQVASILLDFTQSPAAIHSASVHVYNAEEGNTDIMKLDKSSDPKISPKVLILWSTISTDSDTRRLEDLLISRKCTVEKVIYSCQSFLSPATFKPS